MLNEQVTEKIIAAALRVHTLLGPGLFESAYRICLAHDLRTSGIELQTEVAVPIVYDGKSIDAGYRMDLLVAHCVAVEIKAVEKVAPVHRVQLLSYLRLSRLRTGLLINFHVVSLRDGIHRVGN